MSTHFFLFFFESKKKARFSFHSFDSFGMVLALMDKKKKILFLIFSLLYLGIIVPSIVFLCMGKYGEAMFFLLPSIFLIPIFLSFYKIPQKTNRHPFLLFLTFLLRYLLDIVAIVLPSLLWFLIPELKESVSNIFNLVPFFEVFLVYNIVIVFFIFDSKAQAHEMDKKQ